MDAAFPTGKFPGHTTAELQLSVARHEEGRVTQPKERLAAIKAEIARRAAVAAGDVSKMTPGERLRAVRKVIGTNGTATLSEVLSAAEAADPKIERVALRFSRNLLDAIGLDKLQRIVGLNKTHQYSDGACASQDFCDANVFMARAVEKELGLPHDSLVHATEEQMQLWESAWGVARESGFYVEQLSKFQVGQTYIDRSATDHTYIYRWQVIARTPRQLTIVDMNRTPGIPFKRGVRVGEDGIERCNPQGRYSMAPVISADRQEA